MYYIMNMRPVAEGGINREIVTQGRLIGIIIICYRCF